MLVCTLSEWIPIVRAVHFICLSFSLYIIPCICCMYAHLYTPNQYVINPSLARHDDGAKGHGGVICSDISSSSLIFAPMALSSGDSIASIDLAVNRDGAVAGRKDHITLSMLLLSAEELRQKCIAFGIPTHGSKEVIVQRIRDHLGIRQR